MILLMMFAVVAGAGTAITPCVLPGLPALLSASALGGRRRPLGIVVGLAVTFTIAIVALAPIGKGGGLSSGAARTFAGILRVSVGAGMLVAVGGRRRSDVVRRKARAHTVERALGVVLLATGVLMATNLDVRFENALAKATTNGTRQSSGLLAFLVDPTRSLENSSAVQN